MTIGKREAQRRFAFGVDSTDEFETLVQCELLDDGTKHLTVVQVDQRHAMVD